MKFGPYNVLSCFVHCNSFDGAFSSKLKMFSIVKRDSVTFSNPIFSELKRYNLGCLHLFVLKCDVMYLCFLLKL